MENGFVMLRRGVREHMPRIGPDAWFIFSYLLLVADFRKGPHCGIADVNFQNVAVELGLSGRAIRRAVAALRKLGYITLLRRGNQYSDSIVRVEKYDSAPATDGLSETSAQSTSGLSIGELRPKMGCAPAMNDDSSGLSTLVSPNEINAPAPPKKLEEIKKVGRKSGAPEGKVYDPTDRHFSVTGNFWKRLGISKLSENFRPFAELIKAEAKTPSENETVAGVIKRVIDLAESRDVVRPPQLYAILKRYRKEAPGETYYTPEERRKRMLERQRSRDRLRNRHDELLRKDWDGTLTPEERQEFATLHGKV